MSYWDNISQIEAKQTAKGVEEYGQTLEQNQIPAVLDRITYIEEELVDALKYLEWLADGLRQSMMDDKPRCNAYDGYCIHQEKEAD